MKRIKVIATGGTISAHHDDRLDVRNYVSGHYRGEDIVASLPELQRFAKVDVEQLSNFSSTVIDDRHWVLLRERVTAILEEEAYDGVVITHGTNTLEETAYFLHMTVPSEKPIVVTGAQRPFSGLSTDASMNVLNAIQVAASSEANGFGVLVVLNNEVWSARDVSKTNTYRLQTFQSMNAGPLGTVDPDHRVRLLHRPVRKHTAQSMWANESFDALPRVDIVYSYAGADGVMIDALIAAGAEGIVIAGTGAGRCSPLEEEAIERAVQAGIVVAMSSRVGSGVVIPIDAYAYIPFVTTDTLSPQKARILLKLALRQTKNVATIQMYFEQY